MELTARKKIIINAASEKVIKAISNVEEITKVDEILVQTENALRNVFGDDTSQVMDMIADRIESQQAMSMVRSMGDISFLQEAFKEGMKEAKEVAKNTNTD
jgi:hypothetical protein